MVCKTSEAVGHTPGCRGGVCGGGGDSYNSIGGDWEYEIEYLLRNLGQAVHLVQSFICLDQLPPIPQ